MPDYIYPDAQRGATFNSMAEFWADVEERMEPVYCTHPGCGSKAILMNAHEDMVITGPLFSGLFTCLMQGWRHGQWWQEVTFK